MSKKHIKLDTIKSVRKDIINSGILKKSFLSKIEEEDVVFARMFLEYIRAYHPDFEIKANNYTELFCQIESYYNKIEYDIIYNNETTDHYEPRLLVIKDCDFVYETYKAPEFNLLNILNHTTKQEFKTILSLFESYELVSQFWETSEIVECLLNDGHSKKTIQKVTSYLNYYNSNKPGACEFKNKNVNTIYKILSKQQTISSYTRLFFPKDFTNQEAVINFSDLIRVSFFQEDSLYYVGHQELGIYSYVLLGFDESRVFVYDCTFDNIQIAIKHIKKTWNYLCYLSQNLST